MFLHVHFARSRAYDRSMEPRGDAYAAAVTAVIDRFAERFGGAREPVPVEDIADSLYGLRVVEAEGMTCSGMLVPARRMIFLNAEECRAAPRRRRFTIAHELGHLVLHSSGSNAATVFCRHVRPADTATSDAIEREANHFAAELLMPDALMRAAVASGQTDPDGDRRPLRGLGPRSRVAALQPRALRASARSRELGIAPEEERVHLGVRLAARTSAGSCRAPAHHARTPGWTITWQLWRLDQPRPIERRADAAEDAVERVDDALRDAARRQDASLKIVQVLGDALPLLRAQPELRGKAERRHRRAGCPVHCGRRRATLPRSEA